MSAIQICAGGGVATLVMCGVLAQIQAIQVLGVQIPQALLDRLASLIGEWQAEHAPAPPPPLTGPGLNNPYGQPPSNQPGYGNPGLGYPQPPTYPGQGNPSLGP